MPDAMSYAQAAGFSVTYGTAHIALDHRAKLAPGERLLVLGAGGGVGLATVEVGKAMGATVIAAASDAGKLALAAEHGADHLIDYRAEDMRARVKEITGGKGCDVIFDPVGGDAFDTALRCIAWEGRILAVGFASGRIPKAPANILLVKNCAVVGVYWGAYRRRDPALFRASFDELFAWFGQGKLKPHVSNSYRLDEAAAALNALISRQATGKVVLTLGGG
jgi:NADPH2:quinone reductase